MEREEVDGALNTSLIYRITRLNSYLSLNSAIIIIPPLLL